MYGFAMKVYGCQMNQYDADKIRTALVARGAYETAEEGADAIVFVGCSIRDKAEHKVWSELGHYEERWRKEGRPVVAMTGCIAQNVGVDMSRRYPWVRVVSGPRHIGLVPDALETALSGDEKVVLLDDDPRELHELRFAPLERQFPWKASVMISHGCDNFCTYCIVPYVRGRFASRSPREIMDEVKQLVEGGVKEICLLGQNVDTYGRDLDRYSFADLLNDVAHIAGLERLRFMTSYPTDFTKDVVDAIAGNSNICPAINLPIQAGSDRILKAMNRRYTVEEYAEVVDCIRRGLPEVGLTSDLIVGFPGETDEDFACSVAALKRFRFDQVHTAAYSRRQGTPAAAMREQIPESVKNRRLNEVNRLQTEIARDINEKLIGRRYRVLVDGKALKGNLLQGRNPADKVILFEGAESVIGTFADVEVTAADSWSLKGRIL
ncbi:tRNA (N6-isopentenyl adenosine(37)-C2)-methylthiotransferase MiaB [Pyramidobacter sp. SM-530-WT-4B]|uniref:tRNA-2-methylthio-N(6)-dimethylallyladenosine synthase n=1 Tax=Pyramidobacter porci TaxID=2605789 RepID=A0A6L5Y8W7_9BACT|nr:tRNA (N6-isopentenyl adenosine(37)-C2)-methylthiotransferase MiaB [Pyramidobacter porci]MCI6261139.1 tRNA (N6-isopentenyl adenosine(37)-C2)-methylthiotransferase MiaB [Pyramidobacter sp.]MDY2648646.1 tRNA (N6-isopentenyl adenosine(37)-C2)-methylthiotransferase MiaB [Pyramidobacter porci]MST54661.1 tRNA (N6-isopentenyl adenosine(37)-C2)-methylthiotransferase MiaB [Pyramidobacter porci]